VRGGSGLRECTYGDAVALAKLASSVGRLYAKAGCFDQALLASGLDDLGLLKVACVFGLWHDAGLRLALLLEPLKHTLVGDEPEDSFGRDVWFALFWGRMSAREARSAYN
jgi:hypothetical protein